MAIPPPGELTTDGVPVIELDDEIEGDEIGSRNYRFSKIGEPVPIKSDNTSVFDPACVPSRPLAVSERFGLLFVAHPLGFCVAKTKDVMTSAEEIKAKQAGSSLQELSFVDVAIGKTSILALSADDSVFAASVANHVHFFAVSALLHKEKKASYSVSLDDSVCIKDFLWGRKVAKEYVILAENGKLYCGSGRGPLSFVMEAVDAVDWSFKGSFVAVARKNRVSILSSQFKEKLSFLLPFQSVIGDSDVGQVIKVDSIQWMRPDCIAVGCFQINEDGEEENYIVQVITSKGRRITDGSSKPIVLSFNNVFMDFSSDSVPVRNGPHLFLSYLDFCGLAFVANRNLSRHVGLFCWSVGDGKNEVAMVEILNDAWNLYIDLQGDGEENAIVGLSVDKASQNENVTLTLGDEETEVSPCCIITCLTIDGKISVFHFASAAGSLASSERCVSDEEDDSQTPAKHEMPNVSSVGAEESRVPTFSMNESDELGRIEAEKTGTKAAITEELSPSFHVDVRSQEQTVSESTGQIPLVNSETVKVSEPKNALSVLLNCNFNEENQSASEVKHSIGSSSGKIRGDISHQSISNHPPSTRNEESLGTVPPTSPERVWSLSNSNARMDDSKSSGGRFLPFASGMVDHSDKNALQSSRGVLRHPIDLNEKVKPSITYSSFGQTSSTGLGSRNSLPAYPASQVPFSESVTSGKSSQSEVKKGSHVASFATGLPHSSQSTSKQFGNVEEMAKILDDLLEGIEGKGGFKDASITSQAQFLVGLEDDVWALSDRCKMWRGLMDQQSKEVQLLLDKMVQVLVRKVYMEGIFKQAKDSRYWELCNCQKLSSELELKRRHISQLNQELTNKLIELERHFNSLEFNKFGKSGGMQGNQKVLLNWQGPSRKMQSLHSLHNTIHAQLAAAEQLSGCLSKQMASLSIESCGKQDVKKKLFEYIGLSYVGDAPRSAVGARTFGSPSNKEPLISSVSFAAKEQTRRNQASFAKSEEPETARRRRESLDSSWASFNPPKTTVKRMLKEDYNKGSANQSFSNTDKPYLRQARNESEVHSVLLNFSGASSNHYKSKGTTELPAEQFAGNSLASLHKRTASPLDHGIQLSSTKPESRILEVRTTQNSELGGGIKLNDEKSSNSSAINGKSDSFAASTSKFMQKSDARFHSLPSMPKQLSEHLLTPPSDSIESVDHFKIGFTKSTWDQNNSRTVSETSSLDSKISIAPVCTISSGPNISEKGLFTKTTEKPSKFNDNLSASVFLQSVVGPSLPSSNNLPPASSFVSKPSSSTVAEKQEASQHLTSVPSTLYFPSTLPTSTPEINLSAASLSSSTIKSESLTAFSVALDGSKTEDVSPTQTSVVSMSSRTENGDKIQAPTSQPGSVNPVSDLKPAVSASSAPAELSDISKSGSQIDLSGSSKSSAVGTSVTKLELHNPTEAISPIVQSTGAIVDSLRNVVSDVSHEEEMEEEAPEMHQITESAIGNLDAFGIGTTPNLTMPKSNPFGVAVLKKDSTFASSPYVMSASTGELFQPASFTFQTPQSPELLQSTVNFSGGFTSGIPGQASAVLGFGQPAPVGAGQQALGSVLGTFGQSRQLGSGLPGSNVASASGFGSGFMGTSAGAFGGGFTSAASGGGFANLAAGAGGFAAAATAGGGAISGGGFGAFSNQQQGSGGFSAFGGGSGIGRPSSQLFTQMRK